MYWSVDPLLPSANIPQINCELAASLDSALHIAMKTMTMSQFTYPIVHHSLVNAVLIPIDLITLVLIQASPHWGEMPLIVLYMYNQSRGKD